MARLIETLASSALAAALLSACSVSGPPVMTRTFSAGLPTSREFAVSWDVTKSTILNGLQPKPERNDPFYQQNGFRPGENLILYDKDLQPYLAQVVGFEALDVETSAKTGGYGSGIVDETHLYVHSHGHTIQSSYYYTKDGPLPYKVQFVVAVVPVEGSRTKVSVQSVETYIFSGRVFNGHVLGYVPKPIPVQPVVVEEYKLLVYIAHLLGTELLPLESYLKKSK